MNWKFWENKTTIINKDEPKARQERPLNDEKLKEAKNRIKESVRDWSQAVTEAEDPNGMDGIKYQSLFDTYRNMELDMHLNAVIDTLVNRISQTSFNVYDKNGEIDPERTKLFKKKWFVDLVANYVKSQNWSFGLLQFSGNKNGTFEKCEFVDPYYVRPDQSGFSTSMYSVDANYFYDKGLLSKTTIFIKASKHLGMFNIAAKLFIMARENWAFWSTYNDLYTTPYYVIKTDFANKDHRNNLINWLTTRKNSGAAVVGLEDEIQALTNSGNGWTSYEEFKNAYNKEISKLYLGSTMVLEDGSSLSQSKTHEENTKMFVHARRLSIEFLINETIIPMMQDLGMDINDSFYFRFETSEKVSVVEWVEIVANLAPYFDFDIKELTEKISLTLDKKEQLASFNEATKKPENLKKIQDKIKAMYEL